MLRSAEGGLGVDYPFLVPERGQVTGKSGRIAEWSEVAEELEFTGSVGLFQRLEKQSAEEGAEDFHGEEEFAATGNPAFVIGRQTAGGNHAMEVGVEILSPAMEHREEAGGNTEMLRVGSNGEQGFGGGLEENVVDEFPVEEGDGGDGLRQSEDHVEVLGGQQFGLSLLQPLGARQSLALGTVSVATGAIVGMRVLAVVAPFDDTAQRRSPAGLDGMHQAVLMRRHRVSLPVGGAVLSKDVGQLQEWP